MELKLKPAAVLCASLAFVQCNNQSEAPQRRSSTGGVASANSKDSSPSTGDANANTEAEQKKQKTDDAGNQSADGSNTAKTEDPNKVSDPITAPTDPAKPATAETAEAQKTVFKKSDLDELVAAMQTAPATGAATAAAPVYSIAALVPRSASSLSGTLWLFNGKQTTQGGETKGVRIVGKITGLTPNQEHGIHLHANGSCSSSDAMSAGGHFNPGSAAHGLPDAAAHHAGDLGNILADATGSADVSLLAPNLQVADILNRSVIVHKNKDDGTTQPAGNAGPRIGCAVALKFPDKTPSQALTDSAAELLSQPAPALQVKGKLSVADTPQGLYIWGDVTGLTPSAKHAIHIHDNAAKAGCVGDFTTVGSHFDPADSKVHGSPESTTAVHLGDLGNIQADATGAAKVSILRKGLLLSDATSGVAGRAFVIHASPDDFTTQTPPGNAGARVACGIIGGTAGPK